jgi:hypothetical protein
MEGTVAMNPIDRGNRRRDTLDQAVWIGHERSQSQRLADRVTARSSHPADPNATE